MPMTTSDSGELNLVEVSHTLKGLCGIFQLVEGGLPDNPDIRIVFAEGINRMLEVISKIESHTDRER